MPTSEVVLSEEQRAESSSIAQSRSLLDGYVFRGRLILLLSEGISFNTIKQQLQTTAPTISRWKARFLGSGVDGLHTHHPGHQWFIPSDAARGIRHKNSSLSQLNVQSSKDCFSSHIGDGSK